MSFRKSLRRLKSSFLLLLLFNIIIIIIIIKCRVLYIHKLATMKIVSYAVYGQKGKIGFKPSSTYMNRWRNDYDAKISYHIQ